MPIESIEFEKNLSTKSHIALAIMASLSIAGGVAEPAEAKAPRPAPSGETCAQKVAYYAGQGALFGKVKVSDCKSRPQIKNNILQIEKASRYFDYNPIGGVAVAACESTIYEKAYNPSGAKGLFQQMTQYWDGRLSTTKAYISSRSGRRASEIKLPDSPFSAKSNSFVSVYMLARKAGPRDWSPSRHCWNSKYQEVAGSKDQIKHWFATRKRR